MQHRINSAELFCNQDVHNMGGKKANKLVCKNKIRGRSFITAFSLSFSDRRGEKAQPIPQQILKYVSCWFFVLLLFGFFSLMLKRYVEKYKGQVSVLSSVMKKQWKIQLYSGCRSCMYIK